MRYFKNIFLLLALVIGLPMITACNEDDDEVKYSDYYDWRDENEALTELLFNLQDKDSVQTYFNCKVQSLKEPQSWPSLFHYVHHANLDSLASLTPRKDYHPYSTSKLSVHYTLFNTKSVMDRIKKNTTASSKPYYEAMQELFRNPGGAIDSIFFANAEDNILKADTLESQQVAFFNNFTPNDVIVGWGDILQQMYIGDHVVAFIPWFLAYGQKGSGSTIDPYTDLFFRIELCDITHWGGTVKE